MTSIIKVNTIQDAGGNAIITSDGSGNITTQNVSNNTPAFSAYLGSDQSGIADATWTKINMNTEFFDSDGKYDTSNYRFTPTIAGKYMFGAHIYADFSNTNESSELGFYKNGTKVLYSTTNLDAVMHLHLTGVIELDTDDYVELYGYINVASSGTWNVNQDGTTTNNRAFWYGYKLTGA